MRAILVGLAAVTMMSGAGCGTEGGGDDVEPAAVTWFQDVGPIVAEHCMTCHREGGIGPFSLEGYEGAAENANRMLAAVVEGVMPPWDAVEASDCTPRHGWKEDPRLSAEEENVLRLWIAEGLQEGTEAELTPRPEARLAGVTHALVPAEGFVTTGTTDQFVCVVHDPALTAEMWMTGWELRPSNPKVVHHAVVVPVDAPTLMAARNAGVIGRPVACDGLPMTGVLGAWTPGQGPFEVPGGVGWPMAAGTGVLVQMHYHPGGRLDNEPDASALNLRLTATPPERIFVIGGWGNSRVPPTLLAGPNDPNGVQFLIPANVAGHTETMRFTIDNPGDPSLRVPVFMAQPHMHYIGTRLEVRVTRVTPRLGEPASECLVNSAWDFDWQRTYLYDEPIDALPTVGHGDIVEVRCTYDNTLGNPFVLRALAEQNLSQPIDVRLGEQSLDEMCLGIFGLLGARP